MRVHRRTGIHRLRSSRTFPLSAETSWTAAICPTGIGRVSAGQRGGAGHAEPRRDLGVAAVAAHHHHAQIARRGTSPLDHWPYVHAMSMRVPQAKLLSAMLALNGVVRKLVHLQLRAGLLSCRRSQARRCRAGSRPPIRRPAARRPRPTAAEVSHRERRRRHRTLSSTDVNTSGRSGGTRAARHRVPRRRRDVEQASSAGMPLIRRRPRGNGRTSRDAPRTLDARCSTATRAHMPHPTSRSGRRPPVRARESIRLRHRVTPISCRLRRSARTA